MRDERSPGRVVAPLAVRLPHQLEAVYDYLLKLARVRFLLADDAGAGKTIMAGLLIRELKLRGLAERVLIVCPANLTFQWRRELWDKFHESFDVQSGDAIRDQYGLNQWIEKKQVVTSLDLAKRENILPGLKQVRWDLVIVDEAHRMSWSPPSRKTARYALGELLRDSSDHLLLLTATPHKGDPVNFSLFLQLLDEDAYADVKSIREAMERRRAPFYLRRTKEAMVYFPQRMPDGTWEAKKIFTKRIPHTVDFHIDGPEDELYREVTAFVKSQSNRAAAAGDEGINLQCCNILFNYDIPWNPNRLEQRMGRIHRYLQTKDCLIFNFVATNTIEGHVLQRLLEKLQEIRNALEDDSVFNVVGEILPPNEIERILRDYYAGKIGNADLEERLLRDVKEDRFRAICQNALEGLATKSLNLEMLVERRARAQERRLVPETIARFINDAAPLVPLTLKTFATLPYTFEPTATPGILKQYENQSDWRCQPLAARYPRFSTDRETAEKNSLEWVTPGHPLFEALRRHAYVKAQDSLSQGACFYSLEIDSPTRFDFYRARVVDGLGHVVHERLFGVQIESGGQLRLSGPTILANLQPAESPENLPEVVNAPEPTEWLQQNALLPFLEEVRQDRVAEVERILAHIELSLTELIAKEDAAIGRWEEEAQRNAEGAAGNLKQAEDRHSLLMHRRETRRQEMEREKSLSIQGVERMTSILVLPHPERDRPDIVNLRTDPETEATAMRVVVEYETSQGRTVEDVHEKNLGYDLTSLDTKSGELRLIEVKGIGASTGTVCLTPNEKRVAEDRSDCYWLYVVTECKSSSPLLNEPILNPAKMPWHEVMKIEHYYLTLSAITRASLDPRLYPNAGGNTDKG